MNSSNRLAALALLFFASSLVAANPTNLRAPASTAIETRRLDPSSSVDIFRYVAGAVTNGIAASLGVPATADSSSPSYPSYHPSSSPSPSASRSSSVAFEDENDDSSLPPPSSSSSSSSSSEELLPFASSLLPRAAPPSRSHSQEEHEAVDEEELGATASTAIAALGINDGVIPNGGSSILVDEEEERRMAQEALEREAADADDFYCCYECEDFEDEEPEKLHCLATCEEECIQGSGLKRRSRRSRRSSPSSNLYAFPLVDPSLPPSSSSSSSSSFLSSSSSSYSRPHSPTHLPPASSHYSSSSSSYDMNYSSSPPLPLPHLPLPHHPSSSTPHLYPSPSPPHAPINHLHPPSSSPLTDVMNTVPIVGPTLSTMVAPFMDTVDSMATRKKRFVDRVVGGGINQINHFTQGALPFNHLNNVRPCCGDCISGDLYCFAHCQKTGCKPTAMCEASGRGAYASYCQERCKWISGFAFTEFMPDVACRGVCAQQVHRLCAVDACQEFGCYAPECTDVAPIKCG